MPTKVTRTNLDSTELEFEFYLTLKLGLGSVARMRKMLTQEEFMYWYMYYTIQGHRVEIAKKTGGS